MKTKTSQPQTQFPIIESFLHRIFDCTNLKGETMYNFILDYLTILLTNPSQKLPVLCLVSSERNSGKTTFLKFLNLIFKEKYITLNNESFNSKWTYRFESKLIIALDEAYIPSDDKKMREHILSLISARKICFEKKGQRPKVVDFFGKLIFCSNDENNFNALANSTTALSIIKLKCINSINPYIIEQMLPELPHLINFLKKRQLHYKHSSRFWFDTDVFLTKKIIFSDIFKPKIITLCGSTRFFDEFKKQNFRLTLEGNIVLSIGCDTKSDEGLNISSEQKEKLDILHLRKIDLSDEIFVINVGGYIGESTANEIAYAKAHNKTINYLVPINNACQ